MNTTTIPTDHTMATKDATFEAANELMKQNGQTTTKEVKEHLRSKKFWADQKDISQWMKELHTEKNWERSYGNGYNTYSPEVAVNDTNDTNTSSTNTAADDSTEGKVKDILFDTFHIYKGVIQAKSRLKEDIGLTDTDLAELDKKIEEKFKVSVQSASSSTVQDLITAVDNAK